MATSAGRPMSSLPEIAPALLLAIVAEQRAEDEIRLRAELADWPNDDPPRHGDELGVAEIERNR
jgi:hypothetical protein